MLSTMSGDLSAKETTLLHEVAAGTLNSSTEELSYLAQSHWNHFVFRVGETIKINDGPFLNFSGVIEEIEPERGKLKVSVDIFGRKTMVELEYWQVEKA